MSVKNRDMPIHPTYEVNERGVFDIIDCGITKREMFANNAPEMPEWFRIDYLDKIGYKVDYEVVGSEIFSDANMKYPNIEMYFAWRTFYADMLLAELERTK